MTNYDLLYQKTYFDSQINEGTHLFQKELLIKRIENGFILPFKSENGANLGGVVDLNMRYVEGTGLYRGYGGGYSFGKKDCVQSEDKVLFIGFFVDVWGHWLTDCLKHIWFLLTDDYEQKYSGYKVVYIPANGFVFSDNVKGLFEILGLDYEKWIPITSLSCFSEILIPDECFFRDDDGKIWFTAEYREMIGKLRKYAVEHKTETGIRKVYYTYAKYAKFKQIGEYKLERFFRKMGYEVISPEKLDFKQQLNLLTNCTHFATTIGSSAHNTVFLPDNTEIILIPRGCYLNAYQLALDELNDQQIFYIDSSLSVMLKKNNPEEGPFFYYISEELMGFFGEQADDRRYWKENFRDFEFYIRLGLNYNKDDNYVQPEFLQKKAASCYAGYLNSSRLFHFKKKHRVLETILYLRMKICGY